VGWNDVGSWNALYELEGKDASGNAARGQTIFADRAAGNYINVAGSKKVVALADVRGLVVVDTPDALLICRRSKAQRVGDLVKLLEEQKRDDLL
jgi:mannose-1-phosphate guanylyltransferase